MPSSPAALITDITAASINISQFLAGISFLDFRADKMRVGAVLWNMFVIGEATCQLPQELKDRHSSIPWIAIRGMRNVLAHGYSTVNLSRIRDAIQVDVPNLVAVLRLELVE